MHGLWAAIGPTASRHESTWGLPGEVQEVRLEGAIVRRHSPAGQPLPEWHGTSLSGRVHVFIDGELFVRGLPVARGRTAHLAAFAEAVERYGVDGGLEGLAAGSFNAVVLDGRGRAFLLRDPLGTIPVYEAQSNADWLVSTNPVCLARAAGVDSRPDRVGLASWALIGYTIGTRYLVRGVRTVRMGVQRVREADGSLASRPLPLNVFDELAGSEQGPPIEAVADAFLAHCRRLASSGMPTAHMQSGGMDSRLILAAWPKDMPITCYGYGDPRSGEVAIAREVAKVRGVPYHHVQPDGDEVAALLDDVFESNGLIVYPSRWFLADRIAQDGHLRVLDGFAGDILLGHHFYPERRNLSGLISRIRARHRDVRIGSLGLEAIAAEVYDRICELPAPRKLAGFVDDDFIAELDASRDAVIGDIHEELAKLRPANGSLITLVHNFTVANRSAHSTLQQGVMSRSKLEIGYPFASDYDFLKVVLAIPPARSAFRRVHIEIFRRYFPDYARLPYSGSMLPVSRSPSAHQIAAMLLERGIRIPGITGRRTRSPNNWQLWLRESAALREKLGESLRIGGISGGALAGRLGELAAGTTAGDGKMLHIASIGRWLGMRAPAARRRSSRRPVGLTAAEPALAGASGSYRMIFDRKD